MTIMSAISQCDAYRYKEKVEYSKRNGYTKEKEMGENWVAWGFCVEKMYDRVK